MLVHEKMNILEILCSLQLIDLNIEKLENFNNDNTKSNNNNESEKKNQNNIDKNNNNDKIEKSFLDHLYHNEIVSLKDGVDYTILKTEINYEDFKFYMSKIILSKYWIFRTLKKTVSTNFSLSPDQTLSQVDDLNINMNMNIANCIIDSVEVEKKIESIPRTPSKKSVNQIKADAEQVLASVCHFKIFLQKHKHTHTLFIVHLYFLLTKSFFYFYFYFYFYYLHIINKIES